MNISFQLPGLSQEIVFRNFPQHRAQRIAHAVVDKTDMGAPALIAGDLRRFGLSGLGLPEHIEVHVVFAKITNGRTQLAGTDTSVKIHHRGSFAGGTRHCPAFGAVGIVQLRAVMKCQGTHIRYLFQPADDGVRIVHEPIRIPLMDRRNSGIQALQTLPAEILQPGIPGVAANQIEVVSVDQILRKNPFSKNQDLIPVVAGDYGVEMNFKPLSKSELQVSQSPSRQDGLVEVSRNSPHGIMGIPQSVERDVDVQFEFWIGFQTPFGNLEDPRRLQSIRRKIDVPHAVIFHEQIDDVFQFLTQRGLAAAEPQVRNLRSAFGKLYDFVPAQIAGLIQFIPVKARVAGGIAMRRDKEDQRVQLSPAPCRTIVCCGEIRLYRRCRHMMSLVNAERTKLYSYNKEPRGANRI